MALPWIDNYSIVGILLSTMTLTDATNTLIKTAYAAFSMVSKDQDQVVEYLKHSPLRVEHADALAELFIGHMCLNSTTSRNRDIAPTSLFIFLQALDVVYPIIVRSHMRNGATAGNL